MNKVLYDLADCAIHNRVPANFEGTVEDVEGALREEFRICSAAISMIFMS